MTRVYLHVSQILVIKYIFIITDYMKTHQVGGSINLFFLIFINCINISTDSGTFNKKFIESVIL